MFARAKRPKLTKEKFPYLYVPTGPKWGNKPKKTVRKKKNRTPKVTDYNDYLTTPYWKDLRQEVLKDKCSHCGSTQGLQVHHKHYYIKGRSVLYRERKYPGILKTLCGSCHEKVHHQKILQNQKTKEVTPTRSLPA